MKKILIIGGTIISIIILAIFLVVPAFAQGNLGATATATPADTPVTTCPNMQQLCQTGDYQAMIEACQKIAGSVSMPCLDQDEEAACSHQGPSGQTSSNGMMGRGMMNGNMMNGGMMGNYSNSNYR